MKKEKLSVEGMNCGHCTNAVEKAVRDLPGVAKVKADFKKSIAVVKYDETTVTLKDIRNAVIEAGYKVIEN